MPVLLIVHSITRWLAVLAALGLITRLGFGLVKKQPFNQSTSMLVAGFGGLMDIQMLLGLLLLLLGWFGGAGFPAYRWEHGITMLLAVITAHLPALWKEKPDPDRMRWTLAAVVGSLLLVVFGVGRLGWVRWLHVTGLF